MVLFAPPPHDFSALDRWRHRYVTAFSGPMAILLSLLMVAELATGNLWAPVGQLVTLLSLVATFAANRMGRVRLASYILLGTTSVELWVLAPSTTPLLVLFAASVLIAAGLLLGVRAVLGLAGANLIYLAGWLYFYPGATLFRFGGNQPPVALALFFLAVMTVDGWFVGVISQRTIGELERALERASSDGLTGLQNRSAFDSRLDETLALARRHGNPFSILFIDVDFFKRVNDTYGHLAGDKVLQALARSLTENARRSDCVARFGGEEFSLILPHTQREGALILAERLRSAAASLLIFDQRHRRISFTISIGVAESLPSDQDASDLISRADRALFQAKQTGRDRTIVFGDFPLLTQTA